MNKISVITCTYRENPNLDKIAKCLRDQTTQPFEWIIVDRIFDKRLGNFYNNLGYLSREQFPIKVVEPKWSIFHEYELPAVANARNTGLLHVSGDIVLWVDDNNWLPKTHLERHSKIYARDKKEFGLGFSWPFDDWNTVEDFSKREPFDPDRKFCRKGTWEENNPQVKRGDVDPREDHRPYHNYPWPDGTKLDGDYEIVGGAWCYNGNLSFPLAAALDINGYDEEYDGTLVSEDINIGLRFNNYGYSAVLDRHCAVYEYKGTDHDNVRKKYPFEWGYIATVEGVKVTHSEFKLWAIQKVPTWIKANAQFNLKDMRDSEETKKLLKLNS